MERAEALKQLTGVDWCVWEHSDGRIEYKQVNGNPIAVPSEESIQAVMTSDAYKILRAQAYPPLQDLADALVHQAMGDGGAALTTYLQKCQAVKTQYPKS